MWSESRSGIRLTIHARPGAKKNALVGEYGGALKVAVASPPVDGKANETLCAFIAEVLGVPNRSVAVVSGQASRRKVLSIENISLAEAQSRIALSK